MVADRELAWEPRSVNCFWYEAISFSRFFMSAFRWSIFDCRASTVCAEAVAAINDTDVADNMMNMMSNDSFGLIIYHEFKDSIAASILFRLSSIPRMYRHVNGSGDFSWPVNDIRSGHRTSPLPWASA